ncbi:Altered inheritance of mitochondria protein 6-like protein [Colletotrichum sidae]|uniref:Altered inheritance of mitochondria protein 6 n=1 Tax=Colletotrichum sidae TaxID=1347389 RepID=A0A4R8T9W0_9PEZI|nr:Altered inheritance of mitochondria protein 6-like protein [Colletotrichum sidae]
MASTSQSELLFNTSSNAYPSNDRVSVWLQSVSPFATPRKCNSHNDYLKPVPLFTALEAGCTSVEAKIWLRGGDIWVGRDAESLSADRTLRSLYLDPLMKILDRRNAQRQTSGSNYTAKGVFSSHDDAQVVLLLDVKTNAKETWQLVLQEIEAFREKHYLTSFNSSTMVQRGVKSAPLTIVGTGNLDLPTLEETSTENLRRTSKSYRDYHDTFLDAPLEDLSSKYFSTGSGYNSVNSYYASASFEKTIGSVRFGFSDDQRRKLRTQILSARSRQLQPRYWDVPNWPPRYHDYILNELLREGVEVLHVDDVRRVVDGVWDEGYLDSVALMIAGSVYMICVSSVIFWLGMRLKARE